MLFVHWGKSHVRSVLHTDLVKSALKDKPEVAARKKTFRRIFSSTMPFGGIAECQFLFFDLAMLVNIDDAPLLLAA
jgi:hypothetical protein